jgi:hypothetical protein
MKDYGKLPKSMFTFEIFTAKLHEVCIDGLWCLTPLSTIFQLYFGGQFYWWRKPKYPEKTTDHVHF